MLNNADPVPGDKGLSARQLILVFLAGVAVCGIFFSLGFLVGYNERSARLALVTERVSTPATIPPTVNTPLRTAQVAASAPAPSTTAVPPPVAQGQAPVPASEPSQDKPVTAPAPGPVPQAASPLATKAENRPEPAAVVTPPAAAGEVGVGFTVQVAASRTKQDAEALVQILRGRSYPVFLVTPEYAHANDDLYRVQVGPFTSKDDAERVRAKLAQEGFKPFIKH